MNFKPYESILNSILEDRSIPEQINICSYDDVEDFFKLEREVICKFYLQNDCKRGDKCLYRHEKETNNKKFKVQLCRNFTERGFCTYKDHCSFAHGEKELRDPNNKKIMNVSSSGSHS